MKAVVIDGYGSADRLVVRDIDKPTLDANQVLIRVRATSVNPIDWKLRRGMLRLIWPLEFPCVLGFDVAGVVEDVGERVSRWTPGEEVYGSLSRGGGYAEYVAIEESTIAPKPMTLSFEEAASVPAAALTALQALRDTARLAPGHRVLVNGASGGVGSFAVQIGVALGGRVTGVTSSRNVDLVRQLGAERVIDYTREDFENDHTLYDMVFDVVPNRSFRSCAPVLTPRGVYVTTAPGPGSIAWNLVTSGFGIVGYGKRCRWVMLKPKRVDLEILAEWIDQGKLKPVIDRTYTLEEIQQAHEHSESGHARGKIVISL